jgi:hypothetical protein
MIYNRPLVSASEVVGELALRFACRPRLAHTLNEQKPVPANTGGWCVLSNKEQQKKSHKEIGKKTKNTPQEIINPRKIIKPRMEGSIGTDRANHLCTEY